MNDSFGARLKFFRSKAGLSQQQLAEKSGLSRKIISDYEVKKDIVPRDSNLYKLAKALELDSYNLLPNEEPIEINEDGTVSIGFGLDNLPETLRKNIESLAKHYKKDPHEYLCEIFQPALESFLDSEEAKIAKEYPERNIDKIISTESEVVRYLNKK
ncbi:DNA-binding helix-turn-helix protein [Acinetobacter sp. WC-323]|uniref:helix-turn-helix domain-containing protein n=1 Tax=Acinetobacter sp. WC-323 TaxID=903918 RepID=UPI00029DF038|nr:helix-turn-helix transcriptional regulator [Acinetobacter sp. WC-323]EKU59475.1 DNA-binding helix-turn-helix protein [Acinetobacter sp. WC-323]